MASNDVDWLEVFRKELKAITEQCANASVDDDKQFAELIDRVIIYMGVDEAASVNELADLLLVSALTIKRWRRGRSSPHPTLRKTIFEALSTFVKGIYDLSPLPE